MKRSSSDFEGTPSSDSASPAPTTPSKKTKKDAGGSKSPAKAKLPMDHKRAVAEEIISKGIQGVDVEALMQSTGLTKQQIKSRLAPNRNNIRKQLMDLAQTLA